jgi:hypothetical protein
MPLAVAALAAIALSAPVEVTMPPAGDLAGLRGSNTAAFRADLERVVAALRENPAVRSAPPDTCLRLGVEVLPPAAGVARAKITLAGSKAEGGRCVGAPAPGVTVWINDPAAIWPPGGLDGPEELPLRDARGPIFIRALQERRPPTTSFPTYRNAVVIAKPGVEPYVAVTKEEHLRALQALWPRAVEAARRRNGKVVWAPKKLRPYEFETVDRILRDIAQELAGLDAPARAAPACVAPKGLRPYLITTGGPERCALDKQLARVNPAFFAEPPQRTRRVHVIVASNNDGRWIGFDRAWARWTDEYMRRLDYAALAEVVGP